MHHIFVPHKIHDLFFLFFLILKIILEVILFYFLIFTNALIILTLTSAATGVCKTVASIAIPCSVNTYGNDLLFLFAVKFFDRKYLSSTSDNLK